MKNILLTILFFANVSLVLCQTKNKISNPKITLDTYNNLLTDIAKKNIKPEKITVLSDKFGNIISVESKQVELKNLFLKVLLVPSVGDNNELIGGNSVLNIENNKINEFKIINLQNDPIAGKLYTLVRLNNLMNSKKYNDAINLFSNRQKETIEKLKSDKTNFNHWCSAWTLNPSQLDGYTKEIIAGKGKFKFENSQWRIDEK